MSTHTLHRPNDHLIRSALRANALFSTVSGLLFVLAASSIAEFLGIHQSRILGLLTGAGFILVLGLAILAFAGLLFYMTTRPVLDLSLARAVFVLDVAWVIVSLLILLSGALPLTTAGSWAVLIVSDIVAVFAIAEYVGLRRAR